MDIFSIRIRKHPRAGFSRHLLGCRAAIALLVLAAAAAPVMGNSETYYIPVDGYWSSFFQWSPNIVPAASDYVYLPAGYNGNPSYTVYFNYNYAPANPLSYLQISGYYSNGASTKTILQQDAGTSMAAGQEFIGYSGAGEGVYYQTGGTNTITLGTGNAGLALGFNSGTGTYNISGGNVVFSGGADMHVGYSYYGTVNQTGGGISGCANLYLGSYYGGNGVYNLSAGSLDVARYWTWCREYIGSGGQGTFNQYGGYNTIHGNSFSGYSNSYLDVGTGGVAGTYNLYGGNLLLAADYGTETVGSVGLFGQSGGSNVTTYLNVTPLGAYTLSGSGYLSANQESITSSGTNGYYGFFQTGGNNSINQSFGGSPQLTVGVNNAAAGQYTLSGGNLSANFEFVTNGTFKQSGGANAAPITVGNSSGSPAAYNLQNGSLATSNLYVNSTGTLNQSGGTLSGAVNVAGGQFTFSAGTIIGTVGLNAGSLVPAGGTFGAQATLNQTGGTVAAGTLPLLGIFNYTSGTFNGRLVNGGTVVLNNSFYAAQGIENDTTISIPAGLAVGVNGGGAANTVDNEGTLYLNGGTLAGGAAAGSGGPIVNNGAINGYGALSSGVGITNNAQIGQYSGNLTISAGTGGMTNVGTISLQSGFQCRLSSGTLANLGTINLYSSTIAGTGLLDNTAGNIAGPGTIIAPFINPGGLVSLPYGTLNITQPFANAGSIQLSVGTSLSGGSIANTGSIQGSGLVANAVTNNGTIEAIKDTLMFSGPLQNNGGGLIAADAGSKVLVVAGLAANNGTINLLGGTFDNNSHVLSNAAEISGYGTLRTGGLTNSGRITLTGATSTVNGPVTNASGGSVNAAYNPAIFTGNVINNGYFKITSTTVTYAGSFANNGTYISDPASNYFSSLSIGPFGLMEGGNGDYFSVAGPFTNAGQIDLGGTSRMVVNNGAGQLTQTAGQLELGTSATLSAGTVAIDGGMLLADGPGAAITASLVYASPAASAYQGVLAGAGNTLVVNNPAALLVLSGTGNTYSGGTLVTAGILVATSPRAILDGSNLSVGTSLSSFAAPVPEGLAVKVALVPEPSSLLLLGVGLAIVAAMRGLRRDRGSFKTPQF